MKTLKIFLILLHFTTFLSSGNFTSKDGNKPQGYTEHLLSLNLEKYIGKKVDFFLADADLSKYSNLVFVDEPPGLLSCLLIKYNGNIEVELHVRKYLYTRKIDMRREWKLSSFKNETISKINILVDNRLVKSYNNVTTMHYVLKNR